MTLQKNTNKIKRQNHPHFDQIVRVTVTNGASRLEYVLLHVSQLDVPDLPIYGQPTKFALTEDAIIFSPRADRSYKIRAIVSEMFEL